MAEVLLSLPEFIEVIYDVVDKIRTVLHAKRDALRIADQFNTVADVIKMVCTKLEQLEKQTGAPDPLLVELNDLQPLVKQLHKVFKEINDILEPKSGLKEVWRRIKWLEDKDEVRKLLEDLEGLKVALMLALTYNSAASGQSAREVLTTMSNAFTAIHDDLDDQLLQVRDGLGQLQLFATAQRRNEVIDSLVQTAGDAPRDDKVGPPPSHKCYSQWLLSSRAFVTWRDTPGSSLWCHGLAGAGKTTLARIVRASLIDCFPALEDTVEIAVTSLYCRFNENPTEIGLLASLWSQLASLRDFSNEELDSLYKRYVRQGKFMDEDDWMNLVSEEFTRLRRVYIIVDGLDEYTRGFPSQLVRTLQGLRPEANIMYTSRYEIPAEEQHNVRQHRQILVEAQPDDIERFVGESLTGDYYVSELARKEPELMNRVKNKIVESANGIFQVAHIIVQDLQRDETRYEIDRTLENPYSNIKNAYDSTFDKLVKGDERHRGLDAICILCIAKAPLTLHQLCYLASNPRGNFSLSNGAVIDGERLTKLCGGHVIVDSESGDIYVHETVREYILNHRPKDVNRAHMRIAESCLTYLRSPAVAISSWKKHHEVRSMVQENPLLAYSATYWGRHLRDVPIELATEIDTDVADLLNKDGNLACAARVLLHCTAREFIKLNQLRRWGAEASTVGLINGTNLLAYFGLTRLLIPVLDQEPSLMKVRKRRHPFGSILHWAVLGDSEDSLRFILGRKAGGSLLNLSEVDLAHTPLQLALLFQRRTSVKILLEAGADPRIRASRGDLRPNCLQMAIYSGDADNIEALSSSPYAVNLLTSKDGMGDLAIHTCAKKIPQNYDVERTIKRLLDTYSKILEDGDVNLRLFYNLRGMNPVHEAARRGFPETVSAFLKHSLGRRLAKQKDQRGLTAMQIAAICGHKLVVELLVSPIAINDKEGLREQADVITLAAEHGNLSIVALLLQLDSAIVNLDDDDILRMFRAATRGGFIECFEMVKKECNPSKVEMLNALHEAVRSGHQEIVKSLVTSGVDINGVNNHGNSALHIASQEKSLEVLNMLIAHGCDLNVLNAKAETALDYALQQRLPRTARILLDAHANSLTKNMINADRTRAANFADGLTQQKPYYPSESSHIFDAALVLKRCFGGHHDTWPIVNYILEMAKYWLSSRTIRHEEKCYTELDQRPIYVRSVPIFGRKQSPVRSVRFAVTSHDQSQAQTKGTYDQSYTWFEVSTWAKSGRRDGEFVGHQERVRVFTNKTGKQDWSTHDITWPLDSKARTNPSQKTPPQRITKFMNDLEVGDRVCLIPKAEFLHWVNFVKRAEMTVWTSCLRKVTYSSNQSTSPRSVIEWAR